MDFEFPPDILMLRDMLRKFVQKEAQPLEMKYFNTGKLEPEERDHLRKGIEQLGLWGLTIPEAFGGGGLDTLTACLIEEELARTFIPLDIGEVTPLLFACQGDQVVQYLDPALAGDRRALIAAREPGSISPQEWQTNAQPNGDGFIINGRKLLAESPEAGDFFILFAGTQPGKDYTGLTAFLLEADAPELDISKNDEVVLTLKDLRASNESILGEPGGALNLAVEEAPRAWIRTGARYVGLVERMTEMAIEHAKDWVSLGEPLAVRPAIQRMIAELKVDVESVRWLVYHAAWLADEHPQTDIRATAAQVRLASGEMLQRSLDRVTMIFTGPGPSPQIEPHRMAYSRIPAEALDLALEKARMAVAADLLDLEQFRAES
jgi:acyl-CoA dehydrogenase